MTLDRAYLQLIQKALNSEIVVQGRNGGIKPLINENITIDLFEGHQKVLPVITTKKIFWQKAIAEFCWMFNGDSKLDLLHEYGIKWWDAWVNDKGEINKSYGYQIRSYNGLVDQVKYVEHELQKEHSRRAYMSLWNASELGEQALPCCYTGFNIYKVKDELHFVMNFRSSDIFLGLPYDIIVGAMFAHYFAYKAGLKKAKLHLAIANAHLYTIHEEQARELLTRHPRKLPTITKENWEGVLSPKNFVISQYESAGYIPAELAI